MRDIIMYLLTFSGIGILCYVRTVGAQRANKLKQEYVGWSSKEQKLLFLAFGLIIAGLVLAFLNPNNA